MSNSENMTLAERLAVKLKSSPMGDLIDPDDLASVCKTAIEKAFFAPYKDPTDRYNSTLIEAPIIGIARKAFKAEVEKVVITAVAELAAHPAFREALMQAAVAAPPDLMMNAGRMLGQEAAKEQAAIAVDLIQQQIRQGFLKGPQ